MAYGTFPSSFTFYSENKPLSPIRYIGVPGASGNRGGFGGRGGGGRGAPRGGGRGGGRGASPKVLLSVSWILLAI